MSKISRLFDEAQKEKQSEKSDVKTIIKELIDTGWSGSNEDQMKAVQLLKGLAVSEEPEANAFMQKLDDFTSSLDMGEADDSMPTWEVSFKNRKNSVRVRARSSREAFTKAGKQLGMDKMAALAQGEKATKVVKEDLRD